MVHAKQIHEAVLYATDLEAAAKFYTEGFGLELVSQNEIMVVLSVGSTYLLIFNPQKSSVTGRAVPPHGSSGPGHIAFAAEASELASWRQRLSEADIQIESEVIWNEGTGGTSIYVKDPAGNSVELAPPDLWSSSS
ncbi:MAG: VOC family protein [Pirellulaceae bacterium]|nr:VOC family protein [Pirellulaceae bacterium]